MIQPGMEALRQVLEDPVKFSRLCWPKIRLYDKQVEVLQSIKENKETFVHTGNEVGKSFLASVAALWFFHSRKPARVVTSSSGETQLKSILWSEIRSRIATSRVALPLSIGAELKIERLNTDGTSDPLSYIIGHVTKTVENFQGHHLDHDIPRVMAIFDESSGIDDEFMEAAQSWAHTILVLGNPLNNTNFFFRYCKQGDVFPPKESHSTGLLRKIIHIDGEDSPNVILGKELQSRGIPGPYPSIVPGVLSYDEFLTRSTLWDEVKKTTRLHGRFYEGMENLLFPPDYLDAAEDAYRRIRNANRTPTAMGIDGAGGGDDTVWTLVDDKGIIEQIVKKTPNTMAIPGLTIELMERYKLHPRRVCIDAGSGGKEIADLLQERGYHIRSVFFGESPTPPKGAPIRMTSKKEQAARPRQAYKNRRAEMYGILRQLMNPYVEGREYPFAIPEEYHLLRQELAILPLLYDSEGRLYLPPKDKEPPRRMSDMDGLQTPKTITIKSMLGRSPDRADSLVLATFGLTSHLRASKAGTF